MARKFRSIDEELCEAEQRIAELEAQLDEERVAHDKIATLLLPLVGTADGTSVSCAQRAAEQLERLGAPVSDEEWGAHAVYEEIIGGLGLPVREKVIRRESANDLLAARAKQK